MSKRTTLTISTIITAVAFAVAWTFKGRRGRETAQSAVAPTVRTPKAKTEAERVSAAEDGGEAIEATRIRAPRSSKSESENPESESK